MSTLTYKWRTKPYRHQVAAVKSAIAQLDKTGGFALLMEPRTGKTKTSIDLASIYHLRGAVNRVLVVCPVGVIDVWINEIRTHCPYRFRITVWDKDGRKEIELPRWGQDVLDFVIINYDAFSAPGAIISKPGQPVRRSRTRGGRFTVKKQLTKWQPQMIILDESHRIKTPSAKKTTALWSMCYDQNDQAKIPYRLILTGTVFTKK
jgi:superfamily II DNA or RNA helicase